jgi:phosphopantothenoylcysteine synthetase/decarboxylase
MMDERKNSFPVERVLLGVSGSIAAVMVPPGIMVMRQMLGINAIRVIMTPQAARMVSASTMAVLSGNSVLVNWEDAHDIETPHMALSNWAEVFIVMPATANILAKAAHGIADNLLSTTLLAAKCPVVFAPGMNDAMWNKPSTQRNVAQLKADGYGIVPPVRGIAVVDGQQGDSAMADILTIMKYVSSFLKRALIEETSSF